MATKEEKVLNIYETIAAVMNEIGAVGKNSKNSQQGFMYRGIDAVMNELNPAMKKYGMFVVPEILEQTREERTTTKGGLLIYSICKIKYTFYAQDGSNVSAIVVGEGMDSGDKSTNKAMSVAFKYACFQVFCIPTEEMVDPDGEVHEPTPRAKQPTQAETQSGEAQKPKTYRQEQMKEVETKFIGETKQKALSDKCKSDNVNPTVIKEKCRVHEFNQLTEKQFAWICANWTKEFVCNSEVK